ncbi:DUF1326 domain-containing protein [Actinomycetospora soli]|uniref:DUF1326 domain-containing protein n=1 Tax=Actinomycetospora soli TaxID=2893887 RepID=UPI001E51F4D9|nr:DUF1326 domain-containing protein [Actinomycetospora soli]MCD2187010.1 DUF1326 domain-containing protein [Actinomycetospora soli]
MPAYDLGGSFIEACDCYTVCPCWVDDDPDEGHCTGLTAWLLDNGSVIGEVGVGGRSVVSVTTHAGNRRTSGAATVLFVDDEASDDEFEALREAFAGRLGGSLAGLAAVTGNVICEERARIIVSPNEKRWSVEVVRTLPPREGEVRAVESRAISASGSPRYFDPPSRPMVLRETALSKEFGVGPRNADITAQAGEGLDVTVGELPGGFVQVTGRSGMRGMFAYVNAAADVAVEQA